MIDLQLGANFFFFFFFFFFSREITGQNFISV